MKIKVPKTPRSAFRTDRPASDLLKGQVQHLEWAARPAAKRSPAQFRRIRPPRTEGEAAQRIAALTRKILEANAPPAATAAQPQPAGNAAAAPAKERTAAGSRSKSRKKSKRGRAK